jgi:hypothetical protein
MSHAEPEVTWEEMGNGGHSGYLYRAEIPGGWLVRYSDDVLLPNYPREGECGQGCGFRHSICFVPDPEHQWETALE